MIPVGSRTAKLVDDGARDIARAFALPPLARYPWIDRGSYLGAAIAGDALARLAELLAPVVAAHADHRTAIIGAHVTVLEAGDYVLAHHDPFDDDGRAMATPPSASTESTASPSSPSEDDYPLELVFDLSPAGGAVAGADVHYRRRGAVYFAVPSRPGVLAVVERGPTVTANQVYVGKRHVGARVVRLFVRTRARPP